jgi:hypothetical protein
MDGSRSAWDCAAQLADSAAVDNKKKRRVI